MISLNWVGDYIDIKDQDVHELATKITKAGINIEGVITHHINNLVIGQIKEVEKYIDFSSTNFSKFFDHTPQFIEYLPVILFLFI